MSYTLTPANYDYYDRKQKTVNRRCIDGSITGSGKCVAYCIFKEHEGFLTKQLREAHDCVEKGCMYYLPKIRKDKVAVEKYDESERIVVAAISATIEMEGLRVLRTDKNADDTWNIHYVTIANYSLDEAKKQVEEQTGEHVIFSKLEYKFDIAAKLVSDQE